MVTVSLTKTQAMMILSLAKQWLGKSKPEDMSYLIATNIIVKFEKLV